LGRIYERLASASAAHATRDGDIAQRAERSASHRRRRPSPRHSPR
jgi:hypothetical protein